MGYKHYNLSHPITLNHEDHSIESWGLESKEKKETRIEQEKNMCPIRNWKGPKLVQRTQAMW